MIFVNKLKSFFLLVIICAFCYRAALMEQRLSAEEVTAQESADEAFYAFLIMLCENYSLNATTGSTTFLEKNTQVSAASKEHIASKLNNLIEGYAGTIARQLEKSSPDEKTLSKIERELIIIEQAAQEKNAQNLLKNDVISEIRKSIALLRMLTRTK